jgi:hypothetical protein
MAEFKGGVMQKGRGLVSLLFILCWGVAALLVLLVLGAPWLDTGDAREDGWQQFLALFARDAAVRRTSVATAIGLVVTAHVFFQPPGRSSPPSSPHQPPPSNMAGA